MQKVTATRTDRVTCDQYVAVRNEHRPAPDSRGLSRRADIKLKGLPSRQANGLPETALFSQVCATRPACGHFVCVDSCYRVGVNQPCSGALLAWKSSMPAPTQQQQQQLIGKTLSRYISLGIKMEREKKK